MIVLVPVIVRVEEKLTEVPAIVNGLANDNIKPAGTLDEVKS